MLSQSKTVIGMNYANIYETDKWYLELMRLPPIALPVKCAIHVLPPYLGAVVRFAVAHQLYYERVYVELVCYGTDVDGDPYWRIGNRSGVEVPMHDIASLEMAIKHEMSKRTDAYLHTGSEAKIDHKDNCISWFKGFFG